MTGAWWWSSYLQRHLVTLTGSSHVECSGEPPLISCPQETVGEAVGVREVSGNLIGSLWMLSAAETRESDLLRPSWSSADGGTESPRGSLKVHFFERNLTSHHAARSESYLLDHLPPPHALILLSKKKLFFFSLPACFSAFCCCVYIQNYRNIFLVKYCN